MELEIIPESLDFPRGTASIPKQNRWPFTRKRMGSQL